MVVTLPLTAASRPRRTALARLVELGLGLAGRLRHASAGAAPPERVIEVTPGQMRQLATSFEAARRRPPTAAELRALVDDFIKEEIYYREALALRLDRNDPVIRRRLRRKMELVAAARADVLKPTEGQLRAHFLAHKARFAPRRLSFEQAYLGQKPAEEEVASALVALARGGDPSALSRPSSLPMRVEDADKTAVDDDFGPGFFARASCLAPGAWGPVRSLLGVHLVRVSGPSVAYESVRDVVEADWRRRAAATLEQHVFRRYQKRYRITRPDGPPPAEWTRIGGRL